MKDFFILFAAFFLGAETVMGYQFLRAKPTESPPPQIETPIENETQPVPEPTFALVPPSEAVAGMLTVIKGKVLKFSRNDTEYKEASPGAQILLGESVATRENAIATAAVPNIVSATMGPNAELVFANLFPTNFVLQQKNGKIDYTVTQPISVRALHTLIAMNPGQMTVTIINTDMSISVHSGFVKFALVDADNNTRVYDLAKGDRANIDDETREVFFLKSR